MVFDMVNWLIPKVVPYRYNYSYMHPLEAQVDYTYAMKRKEWMSRNWPHSITISCLYLLGIYYGQILMRNRKAMNLRHALIIWNIFLSIFSIVGSIRFNPAFLYSLWTRGFTHTICVTDFHLGVTGFWTELFAASKVIELGDTVFLVLRKRPVIFLHYYHHVTVLIFTWHIFQEMAACGQWFVGMNYAVHSIMYPYYAIRAAGYWVPKWIAMVITTLQLLQMVLGIVVTLGIFRVKWLGTLITVPDGTKQSCWLTDRSLALTALIYFTYFCLFIHFFTNAYFRSGKKPTQPVTAATAAPTPNEDQPKIPAEGSMQQNGVMYTGEGGGDAKPKALDWLADNHHKNGYIPVLARGGLKKRRRQK